MREMWSWIIASACFHVYAVWRWAVPRSPRVKAVRSQSLRYTTADGEHRRYLHYGTRCLPDKHSDDADPSGLTAYYWCSETGRGFDVSRRVRSFVGPVYPDGLPVPRDLLPRRLRARRGEGVLQLCVKSYSLIVDTCTGLVLNGDPSRFRGLGFSFTDPWE
jgi:hypothetical protein